MFLCTAIRLSHKTSPQRNSTTKGNSVSPTPLYNPKGIIYVPFSWKSSSFVNITPSCVGLHEIYPTNFSRMKNRQFPFFYSNNNGVQIYATGKHWSRVLKRWRVYTRVGTLIVATIYLQLIQNRYTFRSFTVLQCSHQHCVQPVASDVKS